MGMVDVVGMVLFFATGQALAWAFLKRDSAPVKIGAGLVASLTVPALVSTVLNYAGVPFNPVSVYVVFASLLVLGVWKGGGLASVGLGRTVLGGKKK